MGPNKLLVLLLCGILLLLSGQKSWGQEMPSRRNFVQVGYGALSLQEMATRIGNSFTLFYPVQHRVHQVIGPVQVSYHRALSERVSLGAVASYTSIHSVTEELSQDQGGQTQTTKVGEDRPSYYTIMPTVQYHWVRSDVVKLYSGISLGLLVAQRDRRPEQSDEDQRRFISIPFGQLTVCGVRVGRKVGGYLEGGLGAHGLLTGGVFFCY
ncbi:hypothetical protein [Rufibacter hautae]|uniref:Outer membrane protein beta-barrel domain-containing protein n=1 Tax=Rufibacter hautae TaxID=2595005 RepID=A0A5B6TDQ8_9BACT|nr:hypothetical protein [Rufibacter hautae]KAA3437164.1 hypothetical protein FOA19_22640 [Rufibacter hautae]